MSFYSRRIFPHLCHAALRSRTVSRYRRAVLAGLSGEVLEIGFGTGLNLPHYPPEVVSLHAVEPNPGMRELAAREVAGGSLAVTLLPGRAEELSYGAGRFDAVVSTFTLCSIPDVGRALTEIRRVLRPGGRFAFLEHGESPEPGIRRWQRWLAPLQRRIGDGCHLDRPIGALVSESGLGVVRCECSYMPDTPKVAGYLYQGVAEKEEG